MNQELIDAIVALLGIPKDELMPKLDEIEIKNPKFAREVQGVRRFIQDAYNALPGKAVEGFREVLNLIQTGSGPVSHDPVDLA